jgi:hypothetical protein
LESMVLFNLYIRNFVITNLINYRIQMID